jgi:glycosyltransferase involved in cell wall biosynthesis
MTASSGKRPVRILIIVENLPVPFDRRVWSEATTLHAAGYEVTVICPKGVGAEAAHEVIEGIHVFRHPLPEAKGPLGYAVEYTTALWWEFLLAWRLFLTRGFDIIHACNPPDLIFLIGGFFKLLAGKKFVFDHHDINPELYEAKFNRRDLAWRLMVLLERLTFRTADVSIATNESYRQIAIERGGMPPDRVHVVRSGPNLARVRRVPPDPAWRAGRRYLIGYGGVIGQQEGIDLLLETMRYIVETRRRTDIQCVVIGSGPALEEMRALSANLGLSAYVTFTGRVDDATLFSALSTADVCVNPDRPNPMNDHSTMNKIMEYMALGKPIVQFDLREGRVSAQDASLYATKTDPKDFGDKILELIDDPARRQRMGTFGRQRVLDVLAWPHEAPKLLAVYDQLVGPTRPALPDRPAAREDAQAPSIAGG